MKIGIIGAGVTGLSMAQLLKDKYEIEVLEKNSIFGGIARVKEIDGIPYHLVGGHCFNSKKPEVMKFVFEKILPESEWNQIERDAKISFKEHMIDYPIEFSIKQIANFNADLALNITADFLNASGKEKENLSEWFKAKFGKTLAEEYLIPYNRKIWGLEPNSISSSWVKDKLPQPSKKQFFEALISKQKDNMPHSVFYYPKANSQNTFLSSLANGVNIIYDYQVDKIQKNSGKWIINSEKVYDLLINTIPLKELPNLIVNVPTEIIIAAENLRYNKVTNALWETERVTNTWTYYPDSDTIFHRHIHIGNFIKPNRNYTITECIGVKSLEEIVQHGKRIPYLKNLIDYNVSDYAYVIYDHNYHKSVSQIKNYLSHEGLYSIGRFGEWEYYNMDICIESAMKLSNLISCNNEFSAAT